MPSDHPFHQIIRRAELSPEEKITLTAVVALSTKRPYSGMTFEEIYDRMLQEYDQHFAPRVPA